jgi:tetratricopeptide (TPR) repeat protein
LKKLKKYEEAIKIYNKVIELNPQYASAYKNKQFCLRKIGKLKPAELYYFSSELMK